MLDALRERSEAAAGQGDAFAAPGEEWLDAGFIQVDPAREKAPLSFAQRSLWLHSRLQASGHSAFHLPIVLKFHGRSFSEDRMSAALDRIVERHSVLRTVFPAVDGEPEQRRLPPVPFSLAALDIDDADLPARLHAHYSAPFDLEREPPLRAALFRSSPDVHVLSIILHHIACDAWSIGLLLGELRTLYLGEGEPPPLPLQFADYAAWQVKAGARRSAETLRVYRDAVGDAATPLCIPFDSEKAEPDLGADAWASLDMELRRQVHAFARSVGTTEFAPLLAAYAVLIAQYTGQEDFLIGTPVARRDHEECEGLIGCFASTIPIAVRRPLGKSFSELTKALHAGFLEALDLPEVSWEQIASALNADRGGGAALCQAVFTLQNASPGVFAETSWGELRVEPFAVRAPGARFDLLMTLLPNAGGWHVNIEYAPAQISPAHAEALVRRYRVVLERLIRDPERPTGELDLVPEEDWARFGARHRAAWGDGLPTIACPAAPGEIEAASEPGFLSAPPGWTSPRASDGEGPATLLGRPETGFCLQRVPGDFARPGTILCRIVGEAEAYVMGPSGALQPLGAVGELCVGGTGIGAGYPQAARRTADRFVPDPHAGTPGSRMFRTGLRARMMALPGRPLQLLPTLAGPPSDSIASLAPPEAAPRPLGDPSDAAARARIEGVLQGAWSKALGCEVTDLDENFFALGGDSILCLKVQAIAQRAGVAFAIEDMFEHQTIRTLAAAALRRGVDRVGAAATGAFELVAEADRRRLPDAVQAAYPLSGLQAGMLYHSRRDGSGTYHDIIRYRLAGDYDIGTLRAAIEDVLGEHDVFATTLDLTSYSEPLQLVWNGPRTAVDFADLRGLDRSAQAAALEAWMRAELERGFELSGASLFRVGLQALDARECMLCLSFHHALLDGWSEATLVRAMLDRFEARQGGLPRSPEPEPSPYRDFIALERHCVSDPDTVAFWTDRLRRQAVLDLPPPAPDDPRPGRGAFALTRAQADLLQSIAAAWDVPFKSLMLAWHARVLGRMTGDEFVVTGMVFNGRPENEGGDTALGMYLNTVPVWVDGAGRDWSQLARHCFDQESATLPFRRFPLGRIQALAGGKSVFTVAFNYTHFHNAPAAADERLLRVAGRDGVAKSSLGFVTNFSRDPASGALIGAFDAPAGYSRYAEAVRDLYVEELNDLLAFHGGAAALRPAHVTVVPAAPLQGAPPKTAIIEVAPDDRPKQPSLRLPRRLRAPLRKAVAQYLPLQFRAAAGPDAAADLSEAVPATTRAIQGFAAIGLRDPAWPAALAGDPASSSGALMLGRTAWLRAAEQLQPMAGAGPLAARPLTDWRARMLLTAAAAELRLGSKRSESWSDAAAEDDRAELCARMLDSAATGPGQVWALAGKLAGRRRYVFGSAETGLCIELATSSCEPAGALPVVRPTLGSSLGVIGSGGRAAAVGEVGDVVVDSDSLAWGYPGASRLTAEHFRPCLQRPRGRVFRTGLVGRRCDDGAIVLYGPARRVHLAGGRWIKEDALEFIAETVTGVERAAIMRDRSGADPQLQLWVCADGAGDIVDSVLERLRSALPGGWVPEADGLAVTIQATSALHAGGSLSRPYSEGEPHAAPSGVERIVAALWAEALGKDLIEPDLDFFKSGGDSIRAMRVMAQLEEIFDTEIPLVLIFRHPTLAGLAGALSSGGPWSGEVVAAAAALCAEAEYDG